MLLTKEVEMQITHRNKKIYIEKGYRFEIGETILVSVFDLTDSNGKFVDVKCDYCEHETIYPIRWCDYKRTLNEEIKKDACKNCWHKKRQDIFDLKVSNKSITDKGEQGYWSIIENVKKELQQFIEKHGYIGRREDCEDGNLWMIIKWALSKHKLEVKDVVSELGYEIENLRLRKANGHYAEFVNLENDILSFIDKYGHFPSQIELQKELGICSQQYHKHGTLNDIKTKMGYIDDKDLVDDSGFINRSKYELITANYLLAQGLTFKRDQTPFKKFNKKIGYKSDFTFYLENGDEIHCEVWGGMKTFKNQKKLFNYDEKMIIKKDLYKKYNINLIEVSPDIFYYSMNTIKKKLYEIFNPYLKLTFKNIKTPLLSNFRLKEMSNNDLYNEIIKYKIFKECLPTSSHLRSIGKEYLYVEVLKRFDGYKQFADTFKAKLTPRGSQQRKLLTPMNNQAIQLRCAGS